MSSFEKPKGNLFDPYQYLGDIDVSYSNKDDKLSHLLSMLIIRKSEETISDQILKGKIKCPCHLGIGQEAIAVGVSAHLKKTDKVFGAHRSHSHFLALNNDYYSLFAETLGKVDGCSHGLGGSMHLIDQANGFYGSVPIVGATIPIATGAALSIKIDGTDQVAVSYLGDGATEEGVFHESMNIASVLKLPVLFVCENNLFASHMHILERQPEESTIRYAVAHDIPSLMVDGNDISAVYEASKQAIDHIRSGNGPFFIEFVTYRWKGHVGPSDDNDVGLQRSVVLQDWKKRDPIKRLVTSMIKSGEIDEKQYQITNSELDNKMSAAWLKAEKAAYPSPYYLYNTVYAD